MPCERSRVPTETRVAGPIPHRARPRRHRPDREKTRGATSPSSGRTGSPTTCAATPRARVVAEVGRRGGRLHARRRPLRGVRNRGAVAAGSRSSASTRTSPAAASAGRWPTRCWSATGARGATRCAPWSTRRCRRSRRFFVAARLRARHAPTVRQAAGGAEEPRPMSHDDDHHRDPEEVPRRRRSSGARPICPTSTT